MGYNWLMLANLAVTIFGLLIFLFLFWKRLKEDYAAEIIFKAATYILAGICLGWAASAKFFPAWFFWAVVAGAAVGLSFAILRFRVKFYETLEAFIISSLPWLGLVFLEDSVTHSSFSSFSAFLVILIMVFVTYYFDTHYKGYAWYKSGKIGFAGLAVAQSAIRNTPNDKIKNAVFFIYLFFPRSKAFMKAFCFRRWCQNYLGKNILRDPFFRG